MDHHTVAAISITGTSLDVIGSLYLAYDLLGGQHGPLRLLTRAVTYAIVFGIGYAIGLGLVFGLAAGIATGITLAIEFSRAARGLDHYGLVWEGLFSAIRGIAVGAGLYRTVGLEFSLAFAVLITIGQIFAILAGCGLRWTMWHLAAHGLRAVNSGEPSFVRRATSPQH